MAVGRRRRRPTGVDEDTFVFRCVVWLMSKEAEAAAKRAIGRSALPLEPSDLVDEIAIKILTKADRDPTHFLAEEFQNGNPANYCARSMRNFVADLGRGRTRWRAAQRLLEVDVKIEEGMAHGFDPDEDDRASVQARAMELVDDLRVDVEFSDAGEVVVSGALTVLVLQGDPDADIGDAPTPIAGATPDQANLWPALWFAGIREKAFPSEGPSTPAQNQFRKRKGDPIADLVKAIIDRRKIMFRLSKSDELEFDDEERGS